MPKVVADLHLHSKYSRAVSQQMNLWEMTLWAKKKGINLLGTGDFTHPLWFKELESQLKEISAGIYNLKTDKVGEVKFLLSCEVSSIYSQGGKLRRLHNLILSPNLTVCKKINHELTKRGANLLADGRPIVGLSAVQLSELIWSIDKKVMLIPAHIWTPWFSLYGSKSGFDSIEECFGNYAKNILAVETGLSSDPAMNWRIKELENRKILSFSDSHSPAKLGREATIFQLKENYSYYDLYEAIQTLSWNSKNKISSTIEFYPEEGKYHYTGHRQCHFSQNPEETKKNGRICPVCHKPLTIGVMHRVEELATFPFNIFIKKKSAHGLTVYFHQNDPLRPPYIMLVPLLEILTEALGSSQPTPKINKIYDDLIQKFNSELNILTEVPFEKIQAETQEKIAEGIQRVREGNIFIQPGYDGLFGVVKIWSDKTEEKTTLAKNQLSLF